MRVSISLLALFLCLAPNIAPAASVSDAPSPEALTQQISAAIPPYWAITKTSVTASVNAGDAVDKLIKQRFEATAQPRAPLFVPDTKNTDAFAPFIPVIPTLAAKQTRTLYGVAQSTYSAGQWKTRLRLENDLSGLGQPESLFDGPVLIRGSKSQEKIREMLTAGRIERIQARIDAAIAKQKTDAATKLRKIQARARNDVADLKAELAQEKRQTQQKLAQAKAEGRSKLAALKAANESDIEHAKQTQQDKIDTLKKRHARKRAELQADYDQKIAALQKSLRATQKLTALQKKQTAAKATLASEHRAALEKTAQRNQAIITQFRKAMDSKDADARSAVFSAALSSDNALLRNTALITALHGDDPALLRSAVAAALAGPHADMRSEALDAALGSDDAVAQHMALTSLLSTKTSLTGKASAGDNVYSIALQISKFDPDTGELAATLPGWNGCDEPLSGALARTSLAMRSSRGCGIEVSLSENDKLKGRMTGQYSHTYEVVLNAGH